MFEDKQGDSGGTTDAWKNGADIIISKNKNNVIRL